MNSTVRSPEEVQASHDLAMVTISSLVHAAGVDLLLGGRAAVVSVLGEVVDESRAVPCLIANRLAATQSGP
eukprot:3015469-Heterocapsa_arctica.AAC.1